MRARVELRASDPAHPERAGEDAAESLLASLPRRRPLTLALVGLGAQAGMVATPWLLTGLLRRLAAAERTPVTTLLLGDARAGEAALRKAAGRLAHESWQAAHPDRQVLLHASASQGPGPARIPREMIGSGLIIVAPLLHRRAGGREALQGPIAGSLLSLARTWGVGAGKLDAERMIAAGHRLIGEVFCGAGLLVDATWAGLAEAPLEPGSELLRKLGVVESSEGSLVLETELVAPERVLGLADVGRLPLPHLLGIDHWLAHLLGLGAKAGARFEGPTPELVGMQDRWPHFVMAAKAPELGLAGRAITGLRTQKAKVGALIKPARAALSPRVPGRFAGEWTRRWYGEERR